MARPQRSCRTLPPLLALALTAPAWGQCLCPADFDCNGFLNGDDFDQYVAAFETGDPSADFNDDGFVTGDDFDCFVALFERGCCIYEYDPDLDADGVLACPDLALFTALYLAQDPAADATCDGVIDPFDYDTFFSLLVKGRADDDGSGRLGCNDYGVYVDLFVAADPRADLNCDGFVDIADLTIFSNNFEFARTDWDGNRIADCRDFAAFSLDYETGLDSADFNCDGILENADVDRYVAAFDTAHLDADGSGVITCTDLLAFQFAHRCKSRQADFDCDGDIDDDDLAQYTSALAAHLGYPCT